MTTKNPLPGMNPFFEQRWRDAHTALITYLRDALQERLPSDLVAAAEEEAVAIGGGDSGRTFHPDLQVRYPLPASETESWKLSERAAVASGPIRVFMDDEVERWLEIRDQTGRLVTVIELLSPSNKREGAERARYENKRNTFLSGRANLVEIDLIRQGNVFPDRIRELLRCQEACYGVCVFRATHPAEREVYPIRLRERLPAIRIPLRPADEDAVLDLQPLIDQCHKRGRYHMLDYRRELDPPLGAADDAWLDKALREAGLRQA